MSTDCVEGNTPTNAGDTDLPASVLVSAFNIHTFATWFTAGEVPRQRRL